MSFTLKVIPLLFPLFQPITSAVRVGMFCVAPFMDETLEYYRAKVHASERKWDDRLKAMRNFVEVNH